MWLPWIAATALMGLAALAQAAPSYPVLMGGRLAFGLAYGILWTTGVAWLSSSGEGSAHLGAVATSAAVGMVAGPALGGIVADTLGLSAPFLLVAGFAAVLVLALHRQPAAIPAEPAPLAPGLPGASVAAVETKES